MAVTTYWYGLAFLKMLNGEIDWDTHDIRITLHHDYVPDQDAHDYWDDVVATECAAAGTYVHNGLALDTPTIGYTAGTNVVKLDATDMTWAGSTIHATHAIIWDNETAVDATAPLICYIDFGGDVDSTAGDFVITFDGDGILTITPA